MTIVPIFKHAQHRGLKVTRESRGVEECGASRSVTKRCPKLVQRPYVSSMLHCPRNILIGADSYPLVETDTVKKTRSLS